MKPVMFRRAYPLILGVLFLAAASAWAADPKRNLAVAPGKPAELQNSGHKIRDRFIFLGTHGRKIRDRFIFLGTHGKLSPYRQAANRLPLN